MLTLALGQCRVQGGRIVADVLHFEGGDGTGLGTVVTTAGLRQRTALLAVLLVSTANNIYYSMIQRLIITFNTQYYKFINVSGD